MKQIAAAVAFSFVFALQMTLTRPYKQDTFRELARKYSLLHPKKPDRFVPKCRELHSEGTTAENFGPLNAVIEKALLWPLNTVYYTISSLDYTASEIALIEEAIDYLVTATAIDGHPCIHIEPRTAELSYVFVRKGPDCSSYVGHRGGIQEMSLADGCLLEIGTIMHEFMHALGFLHEHVRTDRDDFVFVNYENIDPDYLSNFGICIDCTNLSTPYDYGSVMHYDAYAYAVVPGEATIVPLYNESVIIGQREGLSDLDIERVQILYGCISPANSIYHRYIEV